MSCWNNSLSTFRDAPVPTHEHVRHGRVSMVVWLACLASTESLSHFACGLDTGALNWRRPRWLGTVPCKYCMHAQQLLTQEQFTVASSRSVVREPISQHPCPAREQDRRWPLTMHFFLATKITMTFLQKCSDTFVILPGSAHGISSSGGPSLCASER